MDSDPSQRSQRDRWEQRLHALATQPSAHMLQSPTLRWPHSAPMDCLCTSTEYCRPSMRLGPSQPVVRPTVLGTQEAFGVRPEIADEDSWRCAR